MIYRAIYSLSFYLSLIGAVMAAPPPPTPVGNGGTGLTSANSGGLLGATAPGTLAWSGALTAGMPVIGGGSGAVVTSGTRTGSTTKYASWSGSLTNGNGVAIDGSGNLTDAGTVIPPTGTSGHTVPYLDGTNTWSGLNTFGLNDFALANATSGKITFVPVTGALGNQFITVPAATDTLVLVGVTQTLTGKSMSGSANTFTNLPAAQVNTGTLPAAVLPAPTASTLGGVRSAAAVTHQWINSISTSGIPALSQPAFADLSGVPTTLAGYGITDGVSLTTKNQTFSGGVNPSAFSIGTVSSGTATINCGNGPIQTLTNNGAFTMAMGGTGSCVVEITNGASAGAITFSGFNQGTNSGDSLTTTNGNVFQVSFTNITRKHYLVSATQ